MSMFDALVIGGGPGGATVALLLACQGWKTGLVEKARFPRAKVCGEFISATNARLLERLGVGRDFQALAGPAVREVGLFAGELALRAPMPAPVQAESGWGRALPREHLDSILLAKAAAAGVQVFQPWSALDYDRRRSGFVCRIRSLENGHIEERSARLLISAHGSWEAGSWPTLPRRESPRPSDLLGFKVHLRESRLPVGLMPLLAFPGGYGGMVHCEQGKISLSCCIRRDQLAWARQQRPGVPAALAVLDHIRESSGPIRETLRDAVPEGAGLAAGPIRPGLRSCGGGGVFLVGNAAGEAHPVIAEGISLALQSAWLLAEVLERHRDAFSTPRSLQEAHAAYARAWRQCCAGRIRASAWIAAWALCPTALRWTGPWLRRFPELLGWGARLSGKTDLSWTTCEASLAAAA